MPYPKNEANLKMWESALSRQIAKDPESWNEYDFQFQVVASVFNEHLKQSPGYVSLDWRIIKALAWVETGAANEHWDDSILQIGVNGDPGLRELLTSAAGKLILPDVYAKMLTLSNVPANVNMNIIAGTGYFLKVLARFGSIVGIMPAVPLEERYNAVPLLNSNGKKDGRSTLLNDRSMQPPPTKHASATHHLAITGWRPFTVEYIARHYNAGDGNYPDKLQFALDITQGRVKPQLPHKDVKEKKQ